MELLIIAILLSVTGAQQSQLEGPENTLSVVGSNVTLKCSSPSRNCRDIDWQKYIPGASPITIFKGSIGVILSLYSDRYSVDNSSGCDLVIRNVQLTDAGRFVCLAIISSSTTQRSADLIILKTQPKCATNASQDNTVEGDGLQLTCEVTYNGTSRALMVWKGVEDAPVALVKNSTISRSYLVAASAPEVPSSICITSFAADDSGTQTRPIGLATNIPNTICETPAIKVLYSVREVTLSPSLSNYLPGIGIICQAKGHPLPTFKWQEMENDGTWRDIQNQQGSQFTMHDASSKRYRCVAMNVVKGKSYDATSHEFLVNKAEYCLGVGIGIGFLAAIVLGSIAFAILIKLRYLEFHPRPANKPFDGVVQHTEQEINPSSHQLSVMHSSTHKTGAPLVGEQESAYASLGEDREANEYEAIQQRQKAKPKKKSRP